MNKTYFNWSSGKDASFALWLLKNDPNYSVEKLVTTVNTHHDRVSMHGLRTELLLEQAEAIGIPLHIIELPEQPDMETYNQIMLDAVNELKNEGFTHCAFGDIFLEDLRDYREKQLAEHGIQAVFPLWKRDTSELIGDFLDNGFKTITVCINGNLLSEEFVGREINESFLNDLPENVDPCGENGEFHTFCYDGPLFSKPVTFELGEKVLREYEVKTDEGKIEKYGYWFCDLISK